MVADLEASELNAVRRHVSVCFELKHFAERFLQLVALDYLTLKAYKLLGLPQG